VPLVEDKIITQPFGDRSKVVIEPMLTDQWFVDTAKIVGPALEAVRDGRDDHHARKHRKVYFHWLENIEPWTISRQLWWGHQIPVWYGFDLAGRVPRPTRGTARSTRWRCCGFLNAQTLLEGEDRAPLRRRFRRRVARPVRDILVACRRRSTTPEVVEVADR
jgi:valyl-tRNA synthetase